MKEECQHVRDTISTVAERIDELDAAPIGPHFDYETEIEQLHNMLKEASTAFAQKPQGCEMKCEKGLYLCKLCNFDVEP